MVTVRPFKGLRPKSELAACMASLPYDVMDSDEAREEVRRNPRSFVHVAKSEVDLPPTVDVHSDAVYAKARDNLRALIADGSMLQDRAPCYYFYRQVMGDHVQTGIVATVSASDYEAGRIKKHEFTRPDKEQDRVRHIDVTSAQCEPVFLTYRDDPAIMAAQDAACAGAPAYDFTSDDGIRHTLWVVADPVSVPRIRKLFSAVPALYVADGHHRSAAGTIVAKSRRARIVGRTGQEESEFFLAVIFPESQMKIMAYNRAVQDLSGNNKDAFLSKVAQKFKVYDNGSPEPEEPGTYSMYLDGAWYGLVPKAGTFPEDDPVRSLDASILQENLLAPVLGIDDPRTSKRIKFVGGIRGTAELERLVDSRKYAVAFSLYPVAMSQIMTVADSGNVMPPKSTWFEPKLRSGLFVHLV